MTFPNHNNFVACRDCRVLQPVALHSSAGPADVGEDSIEAYADFVGSHALHRMASFRRHGSASIADKPLWDPMAAMTFEVTDGERTYLVRRVRPSIDEPRVYHFAPGALAAAASEVAIDDHGVRRGLDLEFYPQALRPTKVDRFIGVLRQTVSQLAADELEIAFDAADDPAVSIARMPEQTFRELLAACAEIFDACELPRVHKFLHENQAEDGLLALRLHRQVVQLDA